MNYDGLDKEDFDAVVTGELTHYSLWLEEEINSIICNYLRIPSPRFVISRGCYYIETALRSRTN